MRTPNNLPVYSHYRDYPKSAWRWPNFTPKELACRGDNKLAIHKASMDRLQRLRDILGKPLIVNSGYRSPTYNKRIGGAKASQHMRATAFDISMKNHDPSVFEAAARKAGFTGFGFYQRSNFIHVDTGRARSWGKRWFKKHTGPLPNAPKPKRTPPLKPSPRLVEAPEPATPPATPKDAPKGKAGAVAALVGLLARIFKRT